MIKMFLVLTCGLVAATLVASEPPVYGSGNDEFDINSISSYLDDDSSSSSSDSKAVGVGSGSYSYANYNQGSAPAPTSLPYKSPTVPSYPPLSGSTAATSAHSGGFGSSSSNLVSGANYFNQPSFQSSSPSQSSSSYSSPSSSSYSSPSSSPYTQSSGQYESHVSFDGNGGSYSTGFKSDRPSSSGGFNFPSSEAHSTNQEEVNSHQPYHNSGSSYSSGSTGGYKPQTSFGSPASSSFYKDPSSPSQFGSSGSHFSGPYGGNSPSSDSFYDSRPFGSPNFGPDTSSGPEGPASAWSGRPSSYPTFPEGPSSPYRNPYQSGPPPYFKDFTSYKGPHADLPYSPNSHHGDFGPRPHAPFSGPSYGSRPTPYRGKYPSGGKGSRYARHPRPYSGPRGYSGKQPIPRYPSYRSGLKSPYPPHQTRHY